MEMFREAVERGLLTLPCIKPLSERQTRFIDEFKDGTFGLSYPGLLLYCNGRNPRGLSKTNPNGLLYFDKENLFGVGVYKRERDKNGGHLMVVAPRGAGALNAVEQFARQAVEASPLLRGQFLYVRFLKERQFAELLAKGFSPVRVEPWHTEAFAEDETFNHSLVNLSDLLELHAKTRNFVSGSRRNKAALLRFNNFLRNHNLEWKIETFRSIDDAKVIVLDYFLLLESLGKKIGSVPEDYHNVLEAGGECDFARIMKLRRGGEEVPSAVFVGEKVSEKRLALYCTISRRDPKMYSELGIGEQPVGFTALSTYSFLKAFEAVREQFPEVEEAHLGGSETAELNAFKRRLGAMPEATYWAVKKLQ